MALSIFSFLTSLTHTGMSDNHPSPNTSPLGDNCKDDGLLLVLYVLPIVKELTKHLERDFDPRDKRYGLLGNVHAAATVLNFHLRAIQEAGKTNSFNTQTKRLADLLEEVFDDTIIGVAQLKVSVPPRHSITTDCPIYPACLSDVCD
jgi:hypothetical protein